MKGKFDGITKATAYPINYAGHIIIQWEQYYGETALLDIEMCEEYELNGECMAFGFNLAQKYNIEHIEEVVEALKLFLDYPKEDIEAWANGTDAITMTFQPFHIQRALKALKSIEK